MEKKGDPVTQMALISDLFEKMNVNSKDISVIITIEHEEFTRLFNLISKKANYDVPNIEDSFSVKIGMAEYMFMVSKNSA